MAIPTVFLWERCQDLNSGPCTQVLCHLNHTTNPFCFSYLSARFSCFLPGVNFRLWYFYLHLRHDWVYGNASPYLACFQDLVSLTFCLGWPRTEILPMSASQVAGFIGMSHCTQPHYLSNMPFGELWLRVTFAEMTHSHSIYYRLL
jgi:hypothetical protein